MPFRRRQIRPQAFGDDLALLLERPTFGVPAEA